MKQEDWTDPRYIRHRLERSGRTQRELAKALDMDASGVCRLLDGKRQLKAAEVSFIREFLSGSGEDDKNRPGPRPRPEAVVYFGRKIAQAIPFGLEVVETPHRYARHHYIIEPTSVHELNGRWWLETLVIFDHRIDPKNRRVEIGMTAEVQVLLTDDDTVMDVLDMAVAYADFGASYSAIPTLSGLFPDRIAIAERKLGDRYDEYNAACAAARLSRSAGR